MVVEETLEGVQPVCNKKRKTLNELGSPTYPSFSCWVGHVSTAQEHSGVRLPTLTALLPVYPIEPTCPTRLETVDLIPSMVHW